MNQDDFNEVIVRQTDRCKSLLMAKGVEYAPKAVKNAGVDRLAYRGHTGPAPPRP